MRATVGQLRVLVREAAGQAVSFEETLDSVLRGFNDTNKQVEKAHQLAPQGPARAIVAGLHSDLFNQTAEFRKYVEQLKKMASPK